MHEDNPSYVIYNPSLVLYIHSYSLFIHFTTKFHVVKVCEDGSKECSRIVNIDYHHPPVLILTIFFFIFL